MPENESQGAQLEQEPRPEDRFIGLQARLLYGESGINPQNTLPPLKDLPADEYVRNMSRSLVLIGDASKSDRNDYWKLRPEKTFAARIDSWVGKSVELIDNQKDYFASANGKRRKELYAAVGINTDEFTKEHARMFYDRYFSDPQRDPIHVFVEDFKKNYHGIQDGDERIHLIEQDRDAILWIGNIFGKQSSEIVYQFLHTDIETGDEIPQTFIKNANTTDSSGAIRLNALQRDETQLLQFIYDNSRASLRGRIMPLVDQDMFPPEVTSHMVDLAEKLNQVTDIEEQKDILDQISTVARRIFFTSVKNDMGSKQALDIMTATLRETLELIKKQHGRDETVLKAKVEEALENVPDSLRDEMRILVAQHENQSTQTRDGESLDTDSTVDVKESNIEYATVAELTRLINLPGLTEEYKEQFKNAIEEFKSATSPAEQEIILGKMKGISESLMNTHGRSDELQAVQAKSIYIAASGFEKWLIAKAKLS